MIVLVYVCPFFVYQFISVSQFEPWPIVYGLAWTLSSVFLTETLHHTNKAAFNPLLLNHTPDYSHLTKSLSYPDVFFPNILEFKLSFYSWRYIYTSSIHDTYPREFWRCSGSRFLTILLVHQQKPFYRCNVLLNHHKCLKTIKIRLLLLSLMKVFLTNMF